MPRCFLWKIERKHDFHIIYYRFLFFLSLTVDVFKGKKVLVDLLIGNHYGTNVEVYEIHSAFSYDRFMIL